MPYSVFVHEETGERRVGAGIGACILDLRAAGEVLPESVREAVAGSSLNGLMKLGVEAWAELRGALQVLLARENKDRAVLERALLPVQGVRLELPCVIGDYTDFYASRNHARRVGEMFRPERPLLENYDWVPIAYHGRASSIVASGTEVRRPWGQRQGNDGPVFAPSERLDFELELGFYVGVGNELGETVALADAEAHLFGVSLLNDWSARDIQAWESQPLGPFLGKNFCTSVSPWITPMAALEPFCVAVPKRGNEVLPYLASEANERRGAFALALEVQLAGGGNPPCTLVRTNAAELYWTAAQMLAHHTSGGCNLRVGDCWGAGRSLGRRGLKPGAYWS